MIFVKSFSTRKRQTKYSRALARNSSLAPDVIALPMTHLAKDRCAFAQPFMKTLFHSLGYLSLCAALLHGAELSPMLDLPGTGQDPAKIDYAQMQVLKGEHALVSHGDTPWKFRLHNYLTYFEGKYWCIWSHGPVIEDNPTQHVRYATSPDGLTWSADQELMPSSSKKGFRYIARGLWVRDGKLLAIASHDEAFDKKGHVKFFGKSLQLLAWEWQPETQTWKELGVMMEDAINNFPPQKMPNGEYGMLRRDHDRKVSMMFGGVTSPLDWKAVPLTAYQSPDGFRPEEPDWWTLPDNRLLGLFRDNSGSFRFYRAISSDNGRTWTSPEKTNFPDATSKFFCLRTSRGYYVLVSNANPKVRDPLCLSTSDDGVTFTRMRLHQEPPENWPHGNLSIPARH